MEYANIKISKNWGCRYSFEKMCNNARFSFIANIAGRERPFIVLNKPIEGTDIDLIEIGNDRYGIIDSGESNFDARWGVQIIDSTKLVIEMIKTWLMRCGASDLITYKQK